MSTQVAAIADVHANRPALEAVLDDMPSVDSLWCVGDIVGILGWNGWTVEAVREHCDHVVFGNHDARVRPDFAYAPSFVAARDEHRVVTEQLETEQVSWLAQLPDRVETDTVVMGHSRPFYFRDPGYPCHGYAEGDRGTPPRDFTTVGPHLDEGQVALMGHTHEQHAVRTTRFQGQNGIVVNPGSVGVPWYEPAEYAVIDLDTFDVDLCSVEYEYDQIEERMDEQDTPVGKYGADRTSSRFRR